ncbi:MAG: hypothetical protein KTR32_32025 [Granulosicoccus sp.]|nr:hypothetical protein [Granulosicoccus sp.]
MLRQLADHPLRLAVILSMTILISGCLESQVRPESSVDNTLAESLPPYDGLRARVAVTDFSWSVGGSKTTFGIAGVEFSYANSEQAATAEGLRDMMTTSLLQTKRFRVLERQNMQSLKDEVALQGDGFTDETGIKKGGFKGADLVVMAAVTGWDPGTSGTTAKLGGLLGGKSASLLGAIGGGYKKSMMAMDIRIVDTNTSEVLAATRVETVTKDVSISGALGGLTGGSALGGGLSSYAKTPMEKAIRTTIYEAVKYIAENTPKEYMVH